jgi:hypothetical protein
MEKQQIYTDKNTFVQITWSDDSTSIGKMMYYAYDDMFIFNEFINSNSTENYFSNNIINYFNGNTIVQKMNNLNGNREVKFIEVLSESDTNELMTRLKFAHIIYDDNKQRLDSQDKPLSFQIGDYIQDNEGYNLLHKITKIRFPYDYENNPIMYECNPLNISEIEYTVHLSREVIERGYQKIEKYPNKNYKPFDKVVYASESTHDMIRCGFYEHNNYMIGMSGDDEVYFVAPYNFETKMLIGENYKHWFIEFYK